MSDQPPLRERHRFDVGNGTCRRDDGIVVPEHVNGQRLRGVLEDLLHEYSRPGYTLRPLDG